MIGDAVRITQLARGEATEDAPFDDCKDPVAKAPGAKGGAARARAMAPERRAEIANAAALKPWQRGDMRGKQPGFTSSPIVGH
jgi:hypothetical protein